jgi:hypothetical protein
MFKLVMPLIQYSYHTRYNGYFCLNRHGWALTRERRRYDAYLCEGTASLSAYSHFQSLSYLCFAVLTMKEDSCRNTMRLLVTANAVLSSQILVAVMMEAICSSETSALTRATRRHIPEDCIFHSHRCENFKSYGTNNRRISLRLTTEPQNVLFPAPKRTSLSTPYPTHQYSYLGSCCSAAQLSELIPQFATEIDFVSVASHGLPGRITDDTGGLQNCGLMHVPQNE